MLSIVTDYPAKVLI